MSLKRVLHLSLMSIGLSIFLRAGEYGVDYFLGDNDGTITTKGLAPILHFSYSFLIIVPLFLIGLKAFQFVVDRYHINLERFTVFSEKTVNICIGISAITIYFFQSFALPLTYGRDAHYYLTYYVQYFLPEPVYHGVMFAPPIPCFFWGSVLQFGGTVLSEIVMAIGYVVAMLAIYRIGRIWNRNIALICVGILLCYPQYAILYHRVGNTDMLFSLGFLLWCAYLLSTVSSPSRIKFAAHGVIFAGLTLVRPTGQTFLVIFGIFVLLLPRIKFSQKAQFLLSTVFSYAIIIGLWSGHNYFRYDDFTISRTGAMFPFYRLFAYDKIIHPENGQNSRALAKAISNDLLYKEPYKSYEITLENFFSLPYNNRMYADLPCLSDRVWGWDADYKIFNAVALEAITVHPAIFLKTSFHFCYQGFWRRFEISPVEKPSKQEAKPSPPQTNAKGLPLPTENEEIPRPYMSLWTCSPDLRMAPNPNSIAFELPIAEQKKVQAFHEKMDRIFPKLPLKDSHRTLTAFFDRVSSFFPRILYCVALSILGYIFFPNCRQREFTLFWIMAFMTVCATYTMTGTYTLEYRIAFDPIFLLGGVVAIKNFIGYGVRFVREAK